MLVTLPHVFCLVVLVASAIRQIVLINNGHQMDKISTLLLVIGIICTSTLIINGLISNEWSPSTGLMGGLIGIVLIVLIIITARSQPIDSLLIFVSPITGSFVLLAGFFPSNELNPLTRGNIIHILTSIAAYGTLAFAGLLSVLIGWYEYKLKKSPLSPTIAALPPFDALTLLFLNLTKTAFFLLAISLTSGFLFIDSFWNSGVAHKSILTSLAWIILLCALVRYWVYGVVDRLFRNTVFSSIGLVCVGYLGSKAILEFIIIPS